MGLTIQWIKKNKIPIKLAEDCFKRVKKDCFKFIKSQETTTEKFGNKAGMIKNYLIIITCSIMVAIITTIILKYLGLESTAGIAGGVAGGISGALSSILLKNK